MLRLAAGVLAPQSCVLCGDWVSEDDLRPLCRPCLLGLPRLSCRVCCHCGIPVPGDLLKPQALCSACRLEPPAFDQARAWGPYRGDLRLLLHAYKYQGLRRLAYPLAGLLHDSLHCWRVGSAPDWLIPVPLHRRRIRERGFDPPLSLGRILSRRLSLPLFLQLRRTRHTVTQTGLSSAGRRRNLAGAFQVRRAGLLRGSRVLLIDDVLTTGTTANELARTLREAVPLKQILVLTVARVARWSEAAAGLTANPNRSVEKEEKDAMDSC